jgi:hypothetical protein
MPRPLPLDLYAEIQTADGTRYKWDANQPPGSRLQNWSHRTKIGEGFSDGGGQLARRIDQDYADLNLVDNLILTGADGSIAYEGRVSAMPRDLSDTHSIGVTTAGWMAHAKDRMFQEIYVDRDVGQWADMTLERKALLLGLADSIGDFSYAAGQGGLVCALPNQALGAQTVAEAWYQAPPGCKVAKIGYRGKVTSFPASYVQVLVTSDLRDGSAATLVGTTLDDTLRSATITTPTRYVGHEVYSNGTVATPAPARAPNSRSSPRTATTASRRTPATRSSRTACTCPTS